MAHKITKALMCYSLRYMQFKQYVNRRIGGGGLIVKLQNLIIITQETYIKLT